ncbi:unnamed protein product [Rotaria sordida]|uniref:Uncharacterized protein n=1 Tax=Rotaria sordida TaxID=392033 RepID=A0A818X090_9BILA|nr:unnamed protein product [Rotaria sordida]
MRKHVLMNYYFHRILSFMLIIQYQNEITKEFYTIRNIFLEERFVNLTGFFQIEIDRVIRAVEKSLNDLQSAMNDLIILNDSFRQMLDSIYDGDAPID